METTTDCIGDAKERGIFEGLRLAKSAIQAYPRKTMNAWEAGQAIDAMAAEVLSYASQHQTEL